MALLGSETRPLQGALPKLSSVRSNVGPVLEDWPQRSPGVVDVGIQVPVSVGLGDETQVPDGNAVPGVVEVAPVGVGDVVEVGVLLAVERRVVVHRSRVVDLLCKPPKFY